MKYTTKLEYALGLAVILFVMILTWNLSLQSELTRSQENVYTCLKSIPEERETIVCNSTIINYNYNIPANFSMEYVMDFGDNILVALNQTNLLADRYERIENGSNKTNRHTED
jgi:hypothetical protein